MLKKILFVLSVLAAATLVLNENAQAQSGPCEAWLGVVVALFMASGQTGTTS